MGYEAFGEVPAENTVKPLCTDYRNHLRAEKLRSGNNLHFFLFMWFYLHMHFFNFVLFITTEVSAGSLSLLFQM